MSVPAGSSLGHPVDRMLIGGAWLPAGDGATVEVVDPATATVVGTVPRATTEDLDRALTAAEDGFAVWRTTDPWTRSATLRRVAALLRERTEPIAELLTGEAGKPLGESRAEVGAAADHFDWYADVARRIDGRVVEARRPGTRLLVRREPVGPVAAFTAWNFPILLLARKVAPALAAGCSIITKPAEEAPRAGLALAGACFDAGVPTGAVGAVTGDPAAISAQLIGSGRIRKVSLTGSVPVGRTLLHLAAEQMVPVTMELGGHSPVLVLPDADLDQAAATLTAAKFRNCGQVCISPSRVLVHESVHAPLLERLEAATRDLRIGPGHDPATDVGPLSSARRREAVERLVDDARQRGARVVCGGRRPPAHPAGFFYEPTLLADVTDDMAIMGEEPFGPVAPVTSFATVDEAVTRANATPYGLAGYLFTRDLRAAFEISEALEVGMVGVNELVIATAELPFGGVKQSGFGREGGHEGVDAYTHTKAVTIRL